MQNSTFLAALVLLCGCASGPYTQPTLSERPVDRALCEAVYDGEFAAVQRCVEDGADVNAYVNYDDERSLPLILAAGQGRADVVRYLLAAGADPTLEDAYNGTALHMAAYRNEVEVVEALLAAGMSVEVRSSEFLETPLHNACGGSSLEVVKLLVESHGADLHAVDSGGETPLMHAGTREVSVLAYLLEQGAKLEQRDEGGRGVAHKLSETTPTEKLRACLRFLREQGAELNAPDAGGTTPLQAIRGRRDYAARQLARFDALIAACEEEGLR